MALAMTGVKPRGGALEFRLQQSKEEQVKRFVIGAAAALFIGHAVADKTFGVEVYPGAKPSPETNEFLQKSLKMQGQAYVTGDSLAKVTEFYRKQSGLKQNPGSDSTQSGFSGKGVMVTLQNPWMDMKNGKKMESTLVSIVKR